MQHKPTLHLLGLFHTITSQAYSHCAFTGKVLRFPKMMKACGYSVIEYCNEGSESIADEHVAMLSEREFRELGGLQEPVAFHGNAAVLGGPLHRAFSKRLIPALNDRLEDGDIVCHPFGISHANLVAAFPAAYHVETGIGYDRCAKGTYRIFESEAWRHTHIEREQRQATNYEWVIPNYFDLDEWDIGQGDGGYVAFMGRICKAKGMETVWEIAKRCPLPVHVCGQGDMSQWAHPNLIYKGPLQGRERSGFIGDAVCNLLPTEYVEPFGGSAIEAMLCGTPALTVNWGGFTESIKNGVNGYRCQTLRQWLDAIKECASGRIDREAVAALARSKYSLEACGALYDQAFRMISDLRSGGWYQGCE